MRRAAVGAGDDVDESEAEAGARSRARCIASAERLERAGGELRREALPLIADVELRRAVSSAPRLYEDPPPSVPQRVVDEVADGLLRAQAVDVEHEVVLDAGLDCASCIIGPSTKTVGNALDEVGGRNGLAAYRQLAAVGACRAR